MRASYVILSITLAMGSENKGPNVPTCQESVLVIRMIILIILASIISIRLGAESSGLGPTVGEDEVAR